MAPVVRITRHRRRTRPSRTFPSAPPTRSSGPARSLRERHQTPIGWNPNVRLNHALHCLRLPRGLSAVRRERVNASLGSIGSGPLGSGLLLERAARLGFARPLRRSHRNAPRLDRLGSALRRPAPGPIAARPSLGHCRRRRPRPSPRPPGAVPARWTPTHSSRRSAPCSAPDPAPSPSTGPRSRRAST